MGFHCKNPQEIYFMNYILIELIYYYAEPDVLKDNWKDKFCPLFLVSVKFHMNMKSSTEGKTSRLKTKCPATNTSLEIQVTLFFV